MAFPVIAIKGGSVALIKAIKSLLAKRGVRTAVVGSTAAANEFIRNMKIRQNNRRDENEKKKDDKVVVIVNNNNRNGYRRYNKNRNSGGKR